MNPGDLVRVAKSFKRSDERPWELVPDWSGDTILGLVLELSQLASEAIILIDGHRTWVVLRNMEVVDAAG